MYLCECGCVIHMLPGCRCSLYPPGQSPVKCLESSKSREICVWVCMFIGCLLDICCTFLHCPSLFLCSIFPSPEQNAGLSHYQGTLNTGGSLPDLSNLHFPSPLPTPLDPDETGYPNLSGGSSTGNLPAAMMHLGIGNSQGQWVYYMGHKQTH